LHLLLLKSKYSMISHIILLIDYVIFDNYGLIIKNPCKTFVFSIEFLFFSEKSEVLFSNLIKRKIIETDYIPLFKTSVLGLCLLLSGGVSIILLDVILTRGGTLGRSSPT
jgi:hypothetical protein